MGEIVELVTAVIRRSVRLWGGVLAFASGSLLCSCFLGGQTGQEDSNGLAPPDCAIEKMELAADSRAELGFSAADVEAWLSEPTTGSMHWHRMGARTELTFELREVSARHLNRSANGACNDTLGLDVRVAIRTADGLLDETLDATVEAEGAEQAIIQANISPDAIAGTLTAASLNLDLRTWRDPVLSFRFTRSGEQLSGTIGLDGDDPDPTDGNVPVSAAIAELPAP